MAKMGRPPIAGQYLNVKFSHENIDKVEQVQQCMSEALGRKVSFAAAVRQIIDQYYQR